MTQEGMDLERELQTLRTYFETAENEIKSLKAGRRAAAPRARKSLQQIKNTSHKMRSDIMSTVKSMPVKSRTKKEVEAPVEEDLPSPPELKREESEAPVKVRKTRVKKQTTKTK